MTYEDLKEEWLSESEVMNCHTSGSTGSPKLIQIPKKQMEASALRTSRVFEISENSTLYSCISPDYIGGKMMLIRSMVTGANFDYENPSNRPLENYCRRKIDLVSVVPSQMLHILNDPSYYSFVKTFLIGGAPLSSEMKKRIIDEKINAFESYGMTETASHVALRKVAHDSIYFQTLPGISVFYHKENLLGINIEGWGEFLTNDIAEIKSPHEFIILGRNDNAIITGGKKVFPEKLESLLSPYLNFPFFISSRKDEKWGEKVIIAVSKSNLSDDAIMEVCRHRLLSFEIPKEIIHLPSIPFTPNGKIKRIKF